MKLIFAFLLGAALAASVPTVAGPHHRGPVPVLPPATGVHALMLPGTPFGATLLDQSQHTWKPEWQVDKYWVATGKHYGTAYAHGNILLTAGITRMLNLLIGAGGQALDNTHSRIGTGDDSTAASAGQTDLVAAAGSTHRWFQVSDSTYPQVSTNVVTFKSTFASADGNYSLGWQELAVDAGTASGNTVVAPMLSRKVSALGTKVAGSSWAVTLTITIS